MPQLCELLPLRTGEGYGDGNEGPSSRHEDPDTPAVELTSGREDVIVIDVTGEIALGCKQCIQGVALWYWGKAGDDCRHALWWLRGKGEAHLGGTSEGEAGRMHHPGQCMVDD